VYIAIVPVGSKAPIQLVQEHMPANGSGSDVAHENLHGRYYLDVLSGCPSFRVRAIGPRGARVLPREQTAAVTLAVARGDGHALGAIRTFLFGKAPAHHTSHVTHVSAAVQARALAHARAAYVAALGPLVTKVGAVSTSLLTAATAFDPTTVDFDPTVLKATKSAATAAAKELATAEGAVAHVRAPKSKGDDVATTLLRRAIVHLTRAAGLMRSANHALRQGDTTVATTDITSARSNIHTAGLQVNKAGAALQALHS
jgi:hypothetical protein